MKKLLLLVVVHLFFSVVSINASVNMKVISKCSAFSNFQNRYYTLIIDTKQVIYPNYISYIVFEPTGAMYVKHDAYEEGDRFHIADDNTVVINSLAQEAVEELYSKYNLQLRIVGRDNTLENIEFSKNQFNNEIDKCNSSIKQDIDEEKQKNIIAYSIVFIVFMVVIFVIIFLIKLVKNRFLNRKD